MVAAAGYAARTLPASPRGPLNAGTPEHSLWLPKPAGLAAWLGTGVVTFAAFAALTLSGLAANWATPPRGGGGGGAAPPPRHGPRGRAGRDRAGRGAG